MKCSELTGERLLWITYAEGQVKKEQGARTMPFRDAPLCKDRLALGISSERCQWIPFSQEGPSRTDITWMARSCPKPELPLCECDQTEVCQRARWLPQGP